MKFTTGLTSKCNMVCLAVGLAVLGLPTVALGNTVGIIGSDNFETLAGGTTPVIVTDSVPSAGSWVDDMPITFPVSGGFVYDDSDAFGPNANGGTRKLRVARGANNDALMAFGSFSTTDPFPQVIVSPGETVSVEFYLNQTNAAGSFLQMGFMSSPGTTVANPELSSAILEVDSAGFISATPFAVTYFAGVSGEVDSGLVVTPGEWEKWTIDYEVGTTTMSLTIDGPTLGSRNVIIPAGRATPSLPDIAGWHFSSGTNTTEFFIDDFVATVVPEPSTVLTLLVGMSVLGACRWRRR